MEAVPHDAQYDKDALWNQTVAEFRPILRAQLEILIGQGRRWRAFQFVLDDWNMLQANMSWFAGFTTPNLTALCLSYFHVLPYGEPSYSQPIAPPVGPVFAHDSSAPISDCIIDGMQLGLARV